MSDLIERRYLLVKRGLYYGPDNAGYTGVKDRAGRYTQADADFFADDDYVTSILEDEAPMFAPACWNEVKVEHLLAQIATLTAELDRRKYDGVHTCWNECPRVACAQRREIEALRAQLAEAREAFASLRAMFAQMAREGIPDPVRDTKADSDGDDGA